MSKKELLIIPIYRSNHMTVRIYLNYSDLRCMICKETNSKSIIEIREHKSSKYGAGLWICKKCGAKIIGAMK